MPEKLSASTGTGGDTLVPGHRPVTDKRGVDAVRNDLSYIRDEARTGYDAGLSARDAAHDIALGDYGSCDDVPIGDPLESPTMD